MPHLNWTKILADAGLETPGYEEAVALTQEYHRQKREARLQELDEKLKKKQTRKKGR
jgi:hypothetical protein